MWREVKWFDEKLKASRTHTKSSILILVLPALPAPLFLFPLYSYCHQNLNRQYIDIIKDEKCNILHQSTHYSTHYFTSSLSSPSITLSFLSSSSLLNRDYFPPTYLLRNRHTRAWHQHRPMLHIRGERYAHTHDQSRHRHRGK